jgi:heptaprenyl diphosphate synthase
VRGPEEQRIEEIMLEYISAFKRLGPFAPSEQIKKALLVVFPNSPERETPVLDLVQRLVKDTFVSHGLMIGQFHPRCTEGSVHNRGFPVSRAPYPLMAIRHMAVHDILFLAGRKQWFQEYCVRFADRFGDPQETAHGSHHYLASLFLEARQRWHS